MINLTKNQHLEEIAQKGAAIYEKIKGQYEPALKGKFLVIDVESDEVYLGNTSGEAMEKAHESHPNKSFYLVRIGFDAVAEQRVVIDYKNREVYLEKA